MTREELELSLRRVTGTEVTIRELHGEATRWTDNARQASDYRRGRVLLAGDAAHVHSPFSGQGLNLGLGDATNLGWKLAAVVSGRAPADLLGSYTAERHPIGAAVLDWTRAQVALMRPDAKTGRLREVFAALMRTPQGMTQMVNRISGVTQRVELAGPPHPLLGALVPDRSVDGRSLRDAFAGGRFVLLDATGDGSLAAIAARWGARVRVLADAPGGVGPRSLLARPDGVVAWALDGTPGPAEIDALNVALRAWAGDPES